MTAIDWGWGIEGVADRLMELSVKAREEGERYALQTQSRRCAGSSKKKRGRYLSHGPA
jgi:hypothetical protein